jgi:hypothetical protein
MADEIRNSASKLRVVRLLGHRDDAGAWQIRDFLKRSVVEFQWIELSTEEDCRRELGLSDLENVNLPVVELPDGTRLFGATLREPLPTNAAMIARAKSFELGTPYVSIIHLFGG